MKTLFSILILSSLLLTACGKGFQSPTNTDSGSQGGQGTDDGGGGTGGGGSGVTWEKVDHEGYPSGGTSAGQLVVHIDKENQAIILVLPVPAFLVSFAQMEIPELEGAYLTSYANPQGGSNLAVSVPLKYLIRGGEFGAPQRLPNGDPLPYVPSGELPGFSIQFPQMKNYRFYLYIGTNVAAAFVELPDFGLPIGGTFPVKNGPKTKIIGAIGYVIPKGVHDGGVYLATQIPNQVAAMIDDLIRW